MGGVRSFRISTDRVGPRRWCWVRVHPDADHLRAAANRHRPGYGRDWWDDCCGCFQPAPYPAEGKPWSPFAGTLRLSAPDMNPEITAHELVHAAATVYRMNVTPHVRLGDGHIGFHREEDFAYIYGELYASFEKGWHDLSI